MAILTAKYSIGDVVYRASTTVVQKQHACPDCLGKNKWAAQSPAGGSYEFACPRCSASYRSDSDMSLSYSAHAPYVERLTIGLIRATTGGDRAGVDYMCRETGIGSGTIHYEHTLFPTHAEAMTAAEALAAARNSDTDWVAKQYNKSMQLSDYQMKDAKAVAAKSREVSLATRVSIFIDDLRTSDDMESVRSAIERFEDADA